MGRLRLEEVLAALRRVDWRRLEVAWAVLFGGLARRGEGRDVDLLVMPLRGVSPLELALHVSDAIGVDPDRVDVVLAGGAPCALILDAWRHGVVVYEEEPGRARGWLLARVKVCHDYRVAAERLGVARAAAEAMRRRWSQWGSSPG